MLLSIFQSYIRNYESVSGTDTVIGLQASKHLHSLFPEVEPVTLEKIYVDWQRAGDLFKDPLDPIKDDIESNQIGRAHV